MGAPNLVRGGSHSGNVSTESWRAGGTLDILSSDYVPASLIQAAFELPKRFPAISLAQALATVTAAPARQSVWTIAARSRSAGAPIWSMCILPTVCRLCAVYGGRGDGSPEAARACAPAGLSINAGGGRLVLVVGPSGAGKDTLLTLAEAALCRSSRTSFFNAVS